MLESFKNKVTSQAFKDNAREIATQVVTMLVVTTAVKVVTFVAIAGTKALIEEMTTKSAE